MPWLKIDDGFISHPKIAALTDGELRLWMRILCFAAAHRRTRNGRISRQDRREISGFSEAKSARFQQLGLLDKTATPGTLEVHDFDHYNPTDKTAAERKKRQRERETDVVDNEESHGSVTRDTDRDENRDNTRDLRTRARSRTPTPTEGTTAAASTKSTTEHFESQHAENGHTSEIAAAQPPEAPRAATIDETARRHAADPAQIEPLAQAMTAEQFDAVAATVAERCQTGQVRNPAGLLVQLLRERLTELAAEQRGQVVIPTVEQEIESEFRLLATGGHPMDVALELLGRKLRRKGVDEGDWPRLIDLAVETFRAHEPSLA